MNYCIDFYADRKLKGLTIEKPQSIFTQEFTFAEARRNISSNLFKRFEKMSMLRHTKTLGIIELEAVVYRKLTKEDINWITE